VIAREIEKVIEALTSRSFSREEFLKQLDRFYIAIEEAAEAAEDFSEKQEFLNNIYEQFFQGFAVDVADTHGIVYTPQPIVDFMVNSVSGLLEEEFDVGIGDEDVHVLDPFVGTGNFIVRTMKEIPRRKLPQKYGAEGDPELHANEVMLLPYYVASMNIEHEYYNRIGNYSPFKGICLVDTFELAEGKQHSAFSPENTKRIEHQTNSPIRVVIGNPPYNAWQVNANDNNQNREYEIVDKRVRRTYSADSKATNNNSLYDPYVKAIRWASDRVRHEGIVALVTKRTFIDKKSFDGMRKHLDSDFDAIYVLDCGGSVHENPKLSGTTHNVFGIKNGVSINLFVKREESTGDCEIHYHRMGEFLRKEERYEVLDEAGSWRGIDWEMLEPDEKHRWLVDPRTKEFESFLPLGSKKAKKADQGEADTIFKTYSRGLATSKDAYVYDFDREALKQRMRSMVDVYNTEVKRWAQLSEDEQEETDVREFLRSDDEKIKWSRTQRRNVERGRDTTFDTGYFRRSIYRPYSRKWLYFDPTLMEMTYLWSDILPNKEAEEENRFICTVTEKQLPFSAQMTNLIPALHYGGRQTQCFPFYVYDEDEADRCENITDWAVEQFRSHYEGVSIEKSDIFYYVYAVLHHPRYRKRYGDNLRRKLPRIPHAPSSDSFWQFVEAGKQLSELHMDYEEADPYDLSEVEDENAEYEWRVEKMKFTDDAQTVLQYNDFLSLHGIPERTHDYEIGNRSALEWLVDQYRVRTYNRYDITHDPNDPDDKWYIVDLIKRVTTVSVKTVDIVNSLPDLGLPED